MLQDPLTISRGSKARFKNPKYKRDWTKIAIETIDIEYNNTIASNNEQFQKAVYLGYVNPQGIAKWQLFRE
jgi:hypothetical protein